MGNPDVTTDPSSPYYIGPDTGDVLSGDEIRAEVTKQVDDEIARGWLGTVVAPATRDAEIQQRYAEQLAQARQRVDGDLPLREPGSPPSTLWTNATHQQMVDAITQE